MFYFTEKKIENINKQLHHLIILRATLEDQILNTNKSIKIFVARITCRSVRTHFHFFICGPTAHLCIYCVYSSYIRDQGHYRNNTTGWADCFPYIFSLLPSLNHEIRCKLPCFTEDLMIWMLAFLLGFKPSLCAVLSYCNFPNKRKIKFYCSLWSEWVNLYL